MKHVEYEHIGQSATFDHGDNGYVEVGRMRVKGKPGSEFISLNRGYYTREGEKQFKRGGTLPVNADVLKGVAAFLAQQAEIPAEQPQQAAPRTGMVPASAPSAPQGRVLAPNPFLR